MSSIFSRENIFRWLLGIACFAAVIFFFSPSWGAFTLWSRVPEMGGMLEVRRGVSVLAQAAHPGAEIADPLHRAIQWRLLFPVVGYALNLSPTLLFGLAHVGCVAVLGFLVSLLRRHGYTWTDAALATLALGAGSWFFVSTGWLGYYDSWLALGLLLVAFGRHPWTVWAACLWAPWVDERFVMAAPLAILCRWVHAALAPTVTTSPAFSWRRELAIPAALLAGFLVVRFGLLAGASSSGATVSGYFAGKNYLDAPFSRILLGVWDGLRAGWLFVIAAVLLLRRSPTHAALLGAGAIVYVGIGLATAQDYSRSMTMLLPLAALGLIVLFQENPPWRGPALGVAAAAALLLPAHHVMNDAVNPIYYLYHELAVLKTPPAAAMPELRELHAIHAMEQGDYAQAEQDLTLAIKLAANPASAARQRAMLYARGGRWPEARQDLVLALEHEPDRPDTWLLRCQVDLAMHDLTSARASFERARAIAPASWTQRPDVARVANLLAQQSGRP
ncbi:tetratricopeptide repeat protein [Opitutus sp. ER46]|uniref:tetratricopeptide repeat protein n=1 Tax=Opitutus sp. ER46 TaxID=2161864 RepID=UPI000D30E2E2|nr:tetratricopeptide repeat protein [Opitutus sp. ER46]PTX94589.1 hypothetical protein DB354_12720 [Opitutus sp. ER46]